MRRHSCQISLPGAGRHGAIEAFDNFSPLRILDWPAQGPRRCPRLLSGTSREYRAVDILDNVNARRWRKGSNVRHLRSRVRRTGKVIETSFATEIMVRDGKITSHRFFEDSFAVAKAVL